MIALVCALGVAGIVISVYGWSAMFVEPTDRRCAICVVGGAAIVSSGSLALLALALGASP